MAKVFWVTAFEGTSHPYGENIMKLGVPTKIADFPEVKATMSTASSGQQQQSSS